jgi:hypothetical protein
VTSGLSFLRSLLLSVNILQYFHISVKFHFHLCPEIKHRMSLFLVIIFVYHNFNTNSSFAYPYIHTWLSLPLSLSNLLTYLLTYSIEQSLSWEANRFSASQEIPRTLGTQRFITEFTSAGRLSLFWASSIQSILAHPISWSSILILSSHLSLDLGSGLFHSDFPTSPYQTLFILYTLC